MLDILSQYELYEIAVIGGGVLALLYALYAVQSVLSAETGNKKMMEIASAIQEGAQAYLNRQYATIALVGIVVAVALGYFLGTHSGIGFVVVAVLFFIFRILFLLYILVEVVVF